MKAFQKLKDWKESGFRLSDKTKYRLQGGAVGGAVASVLLICSALAIGACSQNANEANAEQSTRLAPVTLGEVKPRNALSTLSANTDYYFISTLVEPSVSTVYGSYSSYTFTAGGVAYSGFSLFNISGVLTLTYFNGENGTTAYQGGWVSDNYRHIVFNKVPSSSGNLGTWLRNNLDVYVPPVASSSEEPSSSEEATTSGGASSIEGSPDASQPVGSVDEGASVTLPDKLAFSTWVTNPLTGNEAVNYDASAPFLLYTGVANPTDGSALPAQYSVFEVGDFYIDGIDRLFDRVAITTLALTGEEAFTMTGDDLGFISASQIAKGVFIVSNAYYIEKGTDERVKVLDIGSTYVEDNGQVYNALIGPQWLNTGYRHIRLVDASTPLAFHGLEATSGWWFQHNALDSTSSISSFVLGNASTGVFGLIGNAFVSIASIMGIAIVPGLTLGTLMFIPLVVLLIMTIIKMVGK